MQSNVYAQPIEKKMLEPTVITWLFKLLMPPLWLYTLYLNLDNWKGHILFIMTVSIGMWRWWRAHINSVQNQRLKENRIMKEEFELREKRIELEEREIKAHMQKQKIKWD